MILRKDSALVFFVLCLISFIRPLRAEETAAWLRTAGANALNPKISVIGDFVGQAGPGDSNTLSMREVEVAIQADVDPNTRADFFFGLPRGGSFELEEGYITLLSLPWGVQARGGKILPNFGRLNMVHSHELPQVDRPQALEEFLGEEGLNSTGAELSRVFTPFGLFAELSYAFLENLGERETEETTATTTITDDNGDPVLVAIAQPPAPADPNSRLRDFANVGRLRLYKDVTDTTNAELGLSGAHYEPTGLDSKTLGAVDFTLRWKPVSQGLYRSLVWRSEALSSRVKTAPGDERQEFNRVGGYSYVEYQLNRSWNVGVRGDYAENQEGPLLITRGVSPYVTLRSSEFNRYRLQYRYRDLSDGGHDHTAFLQWTVVLGPHGAHPF